MSSAPRAAIYARLSRNRGTERSASTTRQEAECRKLAEARGWAITMVEIDDDTSAYSGRPRPGYERITEAINRGTIDAVLAWAPDRLHRSPRELETFVDLVVANRTEVATVQAGRVDLETPAGRMQARMLGIAARFESEHRSERTKLAHEAIAAAGQWKGGKRPYGYQPLAGTGTMEIIEAEAEIIREAARRVIAGERVGSVASDLNRRSVPTCAGGPWRMATLRGILASGTIAGRRMSHGEDVGPATWPAIIDTDTSMAVRSILAGGPKRGRLPRVALLTGGRCECGECGAAMTTARRERKRPDTPAPRIYRCIACSLQIAAEPLEELVAAVILDHLDEVRVPAPTAGRTGATLDQLEEQLVQLSTDLGEGLITRAEWLAQREPLHRRIEEARNALAAEVGAAGAGELLAPGVARRAWPDYSLAQRQAVFDAILAAVVVNRATRRGPGLDPNRLDLRWRA